MTLQYADRARASLAKAALRYEGIEAELQTHAAIGADSFHRLQLPTGYEQDSLNHLRGHGLIGDSVEDE